MTRRMTKSDTNQRKWLAAIHGWTYASSKRLVMSPSMGSAPSNVEPRMRKLFNTLNEQTHSHTHLWEAEETCANTKPRFLRYVHTFIRNVHTRLAGAEDKHSLIFELVARFVL